jgi:hypothetical protein
LGHIVVGVPTDDARVVGVSEPVTVKVAILDEPLVDDTVTVVVAPVTPLFSVREHVPSGVVAVAISSRKPRGPRASACARFSVAKAVLIQVRILQELGVGVFARAGYGLGAIAGPTPGVANAACAAGDPREAATATTRVRLPLTEARDVLVADADKDAVPTGATRFTGTLCECSDAAARVGATVGDTRGAALLITRPDASAGTALSDLSR